MNEKDILRSLAEMVRREIEATPKHWHEWKPGAIGPCQGLEGQYAQCPCGAQVFVPDEAAESAIYFRPDRSSRVFIRAEGFVQR